MTLLHTEYKIKGSLYFGKKATEVRWTGQGAKRMLDLLYNGTTIFMNRKKAIADILYKEDNFGIDWEPIDNDADSGISVNALSNKYSVKYHTIYMHLRYRKSV